MLNAKRYCTKCKTEAVVPGGLALRFFISIVEFGSFWFLLMIEDAGQVGRALVYGIGVALALELIYAWMKHRGLHTCKTCGGKTKEDPRPYRWQQAFVMGLLKGLIILVGISGLFALAVWIFLNA